jgi:hypothetical protein
LRNKNSSNSSYDVQFQLRLNADQERKHIYFEADQWNNGFSNGADFELDVYYEGNQQW